MNVDGQNLLFIGIIFILLLSISPTVAEPLDRSLPSAIESAKRATVGILQQSQDSPNQASKSHFAIRGSGFHIGDGYIVTARHAVDREKIGKSKIPEEITVLTGTLDELPAVLVGNNAFLDIAVYRISKEASMQLAVARFVDKEPQSGEEVFTVGYPLGWGPAMGFGRVGNVHTYLPTAQSRLMQIDLSACSGNSGGGLFTAKGDLVGMIQAIIQTETIQGERRCSRFAFAVPGFLVHQIVMALIEGKSLGFSKIGIRMTAVRVGTRWRVAVSKATGPALKGGIKKGDVLLAVEDVPIADAAQLKSYLIEHTEPGQRISIRVLRGEAEQLLHVTLGKS